MLGSSFFLLLNEFDFLLDYFHLPAFTLLLPQFLNPLLLYQLAVVYAHQLYGLLDKLVLWEHCFGFDIILFLGVVDRQKRVVFLHQFVFSERFKPEISKQLLIFAITWFRFLIDLGHFFHFGEGF